MDDTRQGKLETVTQLARELRRPGESRSDLIRRADKALLAAKRSGRDRVAAAD